MTTTPAFLSDLLALRNANPTLGIKQLTSKLKEKFSEITAKDVRENIPKDLSEEEKAARQKEIEKRQNIEIKEMQREERTRRLKEQEAREEKARAAAEERKIRDDRIKALNPYERYEMDKQAEREKDEEYEKKFGNVNGEQK